MKDAASEAVMLTFRQKRGNRQFAFGAFVLGAVVGVVLMFFVGLVI